MSLVADPPPPRSHLHSCPAALALPPTPSTGTMLPLGHPPTGPQSTVSLESSEGGGPRTPLDSEFGREVGGAGEKRWSGMMIPPFVRRERGSEERLGSAMEGEESRGGERYPSVLVLPREGGVAGRGAEGSTGIRKRGVELSDREDELSDDRMDEGSPVIKRESSSTSTVNSTDSSPRLTKRTRRLSPFDSLATAASSILSSLPYPPVSPIVLGFQVPTDPTQAEQVRTAMEMRAQQMREIERRRAVTASTASVSGPGGMSGLQNALGKLKADRMEAEGSGLAKRRGNVKTKNLTILTPSYGTPGTQGALNSAPIKSKATAETAPANGKNGVATAHPRFDGPSNAPPSSSSHVHKAAPATTSSRRGSLVGLPSARQQAQYPAPPSARHPPHPAAPSYAAAAHQHPPHHPSAYPHPSHPSHPQFPPSHPLNQPPRSYASPPTMQSPAHPPHPHHPRAPPPPASPHPSAPIADRSKAAFLSLFSDFYDSLSDSRVLTYTLEEQIWQSSTLLHSLQESGKVFEEMLDTRVRGVVEVMSRDLQLCENRIVRLERAVGGRVERPMSETGLGAGGDGINERLERLERRMEGQEERGRPVSNVRGGSGER